MITIDLSGKNALVCGSTQGIGRACAAQFAEAGAKVTLLARDEAKLMKVAEALPNKKRLQHDFIVADFLKPDALRRAINEHLQKQGTGYEILVNNSGGPAPGTALDAQAEEFRIAFNQHLICNQILVQALTPKMKEAAYGRIINIISTSVRTPIPGLGVSNTIRGAVASWSKTLSVELASFGITVNNILPGFTETERLQSLIESKAKDAGISIKDMAAQMEQSVPSGRFANPEEPAYLAAFLASPIAAYINGASIAVDGGRTPCI